MSQFVQPMMEAGAKMAPAMPTPAEAADPMAMWKKMFESNEQNWTQFMAQMVATPEFAAGLGRSASNQAAMREAVRRSAQAYLEAANMPSREDLARIASQIVALDAKLDDLADRLEDTLPEALDDLTSRLDSFAGLAARLTALEAKIDRLTSLPAPPAPSLPAQTTEKPAAPRTTRSSRARAKEEDKK
jgi:polyhydroxyalkanoic acid synthase PhaR subunit